MDIGSLTINLGGLMDLRDWNHSQLELAMNERTQNEFVRVRGRLPESNTELILFWIDHYASERRHLGYVHTPSPTVPYH